MFNQPRRGRRFARFVLLLGATILGREGFADAHALWTDPMPRDNKDGYKPPQPGFTLPCGVARSAAQPVTKIPAGSMRTVRFTETVAHPGCFLVEFANSDSETFQRLTVIKRTNARMFTAAITLPNQACTNCVLRLRQLMLANDAATCPPATINDMATNLYYSCANITLEGGGGGDASVPADAGVDLATADAPPPDTGGGSGGAGGSASGTGGAVGSGGSGGMTAGTGGSTGTGGSGTGGSSSGTGGNRPGTGGNTGGGETGGGGCAIASVPSPATLWALPMMGLVALIVARRRRR